MTRARRIFLALAAVSAAALLAWQALPRSPSGWSDADADILRSLSLDSLPPLPQDPSNAVADDPRAAAMGRRLFFDARLSGNGAVSCATCHQPERRFTDGLPRARAIGQSRRNTPSIAGTAHSPWLYWDGRRDSQWAQALSPLEDPAEHGGNRMAYARFVVGDPAYRSDYEALFGPAPDFGDSDRFPDAASPLGTAAERQAWSGMSAADRSEVNAVFSNIGKSIAAFERTLLPGKSRFDEYVASLSSAAGPSEDLLSRDEILGLELFIGEARCIECHNGPLFTNNEFHNTGLLSIPGELPDRGRIDGVRQVIADPFNCLGDFSDDPDRRCSELEFARTGAELLGATRTPSLRNLDETAPFQRRGQFDTLAEVLDHYNRAPLAMIGHNEAKPLGLGSRELSWLEAFLGSLQAPLATHGPAGEAADGLSEPGR